jgi:hypothetical protein
MKELPLLLLVIGVVFIAGCIGQSEEEKLGVATGVIIKSFSPDISEVFSEDEATFTLYVENVGEADAETVSVYFFGLSTDWKPNSGTCPIGELTKAQPQYEIMGGTGDCQFVSQSPSLKVDTTYTVNARVSYSYETSALGDIRVYNRTYLDTLPVEEVESIIKSSGVASFEITDAPVSVSLVGVARPFIIKTAKDATITVRINNIGQGQSYQDTQGDREVEITKLEVYETDCTPAEPVKLPRTGHKSITCTFDLPSVDTLTTFPVKVELSYKYFVDASTSINVLKEMI